MACWHTRQRPSVVVSKANSALCHTVQIWSLKLLAAICANHVPIQAVKKNNYYISRCRARGCHAREVNACNPVRDGKSYNDGHQERVRRADS